MKKILIIGFFILIMTMSLLVACTNNNVNNNNNNTNSSENLQGDAAGMLPVEDGGVGSNRLGLDEGSKRGGSSDCVSTSSNCQGCKRCCGREMGDSGCSSQCQIAFTSSCD